MAVIEAFAPAKVNLTLHVTGKRADGYHTLESLVVFAGIGDRLTMTPAPDLSLNVTGPMAAGVPGDGTNLVLRAAQMLRDLRGVVTGADIVLDKHLPNGGGIGGGSSDAAAAIRGLAQLWDVAPLSGAETLRLGADIPVCLQAPQPMTMSGIGEVLTPAIVPGGWLVLANPGVHVPTGAVFSRLASGYGAQNAPMSARVGEDFAPWLAEQRNDLAAPAIDIAPQIGEVLAALRGVGPIGADMSGSGSTCWALFADQDRAEGAAQALRAARPDWWVRAAAILT